MRNVCGVFFLWGSFLLVSPGVSAQCVFNFDNLNKIMSLTADCTTDMTILIPDGFTLDGNGYTITAVDPATGPFLGAVVRNGGPTAHVRNLTITTSSLANVCHEGGVPDERLRGILFDGAAGSITMNTVFNLNQGASGCQEGNAIEVRNAPFDGTHPATKSVEIAQNQLSLFQKSGIVCNGDVDCYIHHNTIGSSATQENLAANSLQLGFGARGMVEHNHIAGNQWLGASNFAATAILLFDAGDAIVRRNNLMEGNADVGIFVINGLFAPAAVVVVNNNRVFETGEDGPHGDFGIADFLSNSEVTNNKVRGYDTAYFGVVGGNNKTIPSPNNP